MELDEIHAYCLQLPGVSEDFPFDEHTLVFRVMGKIFLLTNLEAYPSRINLKCDPTLAITLREQHPAVQPGYHMSKKHWNTVTLDGSVPASTMRDWIDHSYTLVASGLKKADRDLLAAQRGSAQVT